MADLFWPGDERAGDLFSDEALPRGDGRRRGRLARRPRRRGPRPDGGRRATSTAWSATRPRRRSPTSAEAGGNPVDRRSSRCCATGSPPQPDAARWLHRGLTSQDVVDTALMLLRPRRRRRGCVDELARQVGALADLAEQHRDDADGRPAPSPSTPSPPPSASRRRGWLTGVLDAHDDLAALALPVQVGGAAGTLAAVVELAGDRRPGRAASRRTSPRTLGPGPAPPWHTTPGAASPGSATRWSRCTDAWGRIANDVLTLSPARDRRARREGRRRRVVDDAAQGATRCSPCWSAAPR